MTATRHPTIIGVLRTSVNTTQIDTAQNKYPPFCMRFRLYIRSTYCRLSCCNAKTGAERVWLPVCEQTTTPSINGTKLVPDQCLGSSLYIFSFDFRLQTTCPHCTLLALFGHLNDTSLSLELLYFFFDKQERHKDLQSVYLLLVCFLPHQLLTAIWVSQGGVSQELGKSPSYIPKVKWGGPWFCNQCVPALGISAVKTPRELVRVGWK